MFSFERVEGRFGEFEVVNVTGHRKGIPASMARKIVDNFAEFKSLVDANAPAKPAPAKPAPAKAAKPTGIVGQLLSMSPEERAELKALLGDDKPAPVQTDPEAAKPANVKRLPGRKVSKGELLG